MQKLAPFAINTSITSIIANIHAVQQIEKNSFNDQEKQTYRKTKCCRAFSQTGNNCEKKKQWS